MSQDEVKKALDEIRPQLRMHGGDVKLVDVIDGVVKVNLTGACQGCPMSQMTLKNGIENFLKKKVPTIREVESV